MVTTARRAKARDLHIGDWWCDADAETAVWHRVQSLGKYINWVTVKDGKGGLHRMLPNHHVMIRTQAP